MKYCLNIHTLDNDPEIEITQKEYNELQSAHEILTNARAIEEKYDILIFNYLEFEKEILNSTVASMVYRIYEIPKIFEIRQRIEVRLINLLSSARLYIDQSRQNAYRCNPLDSDVPKKIKNLFSKEYDSSKDYRFMDTLRNYVQHRGLPVHMTTHGLRRTSHDDDSMIEYNFGLSSFKSRFEADSKFKREVLVGFGDKIDLKSTTRGYIESISMVHFSTREIINDSVLNARKLIESAHLRFSKYGTKINSLRLHQIAENGHTKSIPLLLDWDDIRIELIKKNRQLFNLKKSYVTGIIKKD